ncbi:murein biosynthesis integral membrane protein MurJ [Desertihabitans aurantiacus]|uniref:murein biosynthesis integral membrane protein MurJ n=1 Tax=Desertihabitans aurantiacus TaxID=2282477 RepID=UPI000DF7DB9C|nr:murein biosynthesis integral membrane protein MurJ [Desertihabitans aurantiacus]
MSTDVASRSLISSSALMASGTMVSRVLGFVRAVLIATVLGNATRQGEIFTFANTVPNSLYILFAGGALNSVLVPQIVRATRHDEDEGEAYTNRIMTAFLAIIAAVTVVVILLAPLVLRIYTDAGWRDPALSEQYRSMLTLTYLCLPQIFFYGAFFLAGQVLNARGRFGPMMWAPIVNNLVSIAIFVGYLLVFGTGGDRSQAFTTGQELLLGIGSTLGIAVQAAVLLPFLRRAGFVYRPRFDLRGVGLGRTFSLAKWTLGFVVMTQLALVVVNRLASTATTASETGGGLLVYQNAYLVWILPHSVITVSLATAMVTSASDLAAQGDLRGVARETTRTMKLASTVLLPAAVAFVVLAQPVARLAFGFGEGAADYPLVGWALAAFALGLVPFTLFYLCTRAFYSLEDTRTPFLLQALVAGLNAGLAVLLVQLVDSPRLVAAALALSYSLAYLLAVVVALLRLRARLPGLDLRAVVRHLVRVVVAIAPAALVAWLVTWALGMVGDGRLVSALALALAGVLAVVVYVVMARVLHLREVDDIVGTLLRRGSGGAPAEADAGTRDPDAVGTREDGGHEPARRTEDEVPDAEEEGRDPADARPAPASSDADTAPLDAVDRPTPAAPTLPPTVRAALPDDSTDPDATRRNPIQPDALEPDADDTPPDGSASTQRAGDLLGRRYRLQEIVAGRSDTHTWRAFDQVLSRSVLVQVLPPDDPRSPALLEAARASAAATDSRFLRVLDAVPGDAPGVGSYIVTEYASGQTLEVLLSQGPLSALEAAWLVREAADALTGVHAFGLHHRHLGPDAVTVTPAGNLKITGFLLDAAISDADPGAEPAGVRTEDGEARDVEDLGRLLYAALVCRWPGGHRFGLERAPVHGERLLTPRQVQHGVSPALDRICDQILSPVPRGHEPRLTTAAEVSAALTRVLGTADASHDLERRVRQPVPVVGSDDPDAVVGPTPPEIVHATHTSPSSAASDDPERPGSVRVVHTGAPRQRRWLAVLVLLLVLALIGALVTVFVQSQARFAGDAPDPTSAPPPGPVQVQGVTVFDPEGDPPGEENNEEAPLAVDGDPETAWQSVYYRGDPELGGLKRGVGLVLDLGEVRDITAVSVLLPEEPTALEVLAPTDRSTAEAPLDSDESWEVVAEDGSATGQTELALAETTSTRFVLVYLTSLPPAGDSYRGSIYEVGVSG